MEDFSRNIALVVRRPVISYRAFSPVHNDEFSRPLGTQRALLLLEELAFSTARDAAHFASRFCGASYAGPAAVSAAQPFGCLARLPKLSLFPSAQQRSLPGAAECTIDSSALDRIDGQLIGFFVALAAKANPGMASFLQLFAPPPDACGEERQKS